ncbi:signal peptidase I [Fuscibacter oryzae]|uniref:Signal peptidase I n=1 Tax=Fuscibacter oryzae TaxID=2803939 RepID=A0A8J7SRP7_9RHOB|nr:signal peptidase I [Fuscibacter oryzae]MBL4927080.1 signal peptidase I [Fuscibacter oryzae]
MKRFDLSGTAPRREAIVVVTALVAAVVLRALTEARYPGAEPWLVMAIGLIATLTIATLIRRLHDTGRSGIYALLALVPYLGPLLTLALLALPSRRPYLQGHPTLRAMGGVLLGLLAVLSLSRLFWTPYWIPSEADKPTLLPGDYVAVRLLSPTSFQRGDMVVFRHPLTGESYIKRLIGLPGERVQVKDGIVFINDQPLPQSPAGTFTELKAPQGPAHALPRCANDPVGLGGICETPQLTELLPDGRSHAIVNLEPAGFADNTQVFTVPAGHYFMLGDNRDNSLDSRFAQSVGGMGFVPAENLVGRASRVIVSAEGPYLLAFWTWRPNRYLLGVQ